MLQKELREINLNFEFFYKAYQECFNKILKAEYKFPDDNSPYKIIAQISEGFLHNVCMKLYLEEVLPTELKKDSKFYEKEFFKAMENEDIASLSFLALALHNNSIYHQYIKAESMYQLLHKCLDILHKNGTDMMGNNIMAMVYEDILIIGYTSDAEDLERPYSLCKKLFALEENESWRECNISRMYYDTFAGLLYGSNVGKREFDLLVDFYHKTTLTFIKEQYLYKDLHYFINAGLCDENFNWLGEK